MEPDKKPTEMPAVTEPKSGWDPNQVQAVALPQVESVSTAPEETVPNPVSEPLPIQQVTETTVSNSTTEALSVEPPVVESPFTPRTYTELNEPPLPLGTAVRDLQPKVEAPQAIAQEVLLPPTSPMTTQTKTGAWDTIKSFLSFGKKS